MTIEIILGLIGLSLVLGVLPRNWNRVNLLVAASVLIMFWLHPESSLRHLAFWMPILSLFLIISTWAVITTPEIRKKPQTLTTLMLIFVLVLAVKGLQILNLNILSGFGRAPSILQILLAWLLMSGIWLLLIRARIHTGAATWFVFSLLLALFIILKMPQLSQLASQAWRSASGQLIDLALAADIQWLGYSYIAFRLLHTIRDQQTGRYSSVPLNEYIAYTLFFPALIAGPIARLNQVETQLRKPDPFSTTVFLEGSQRILVGLFKKFVLADSLAVFALNNQNALQPSSGFGAWVLLYAFSFQIYLDFSGYTDIAIGLGTYLGITLPENFNQPYRKPNLTQFWNNWHMSLTNWFRAYFFNPLSRSLRKKKLPALQILIITQISTMILVGLWHGITINFAFWGLWHGLGLLIQNRWSGWVKKFQPQPGARPIWQKVLHGLGVGLTFNYVTLGWIWFVLPSPEIAFHFLGTLLGLT